VLWGLIWVDDSVQNAFKFLEAECWFRGDLSYLLRPSQVEIYERIHQWKAENPNKLGPVVVNCHRAFGKSFLLALLAIERCLRYPGQETRISSPTFKQTKEIIAPILKKILAHCPQELVPTSRQAKLMFKNPRWEEGALESTLHISTCKDDAETQRGLRSDFVAIDECRDVSNFDYVVSSVYLFHFAQRENPLFILSSTPPDSTDHAWSRIYVDRARRDERYFEFPVIKNQDWTETDDEMLVDVCGGKDTPAWKREALCLLISDSSKMIVPEILNAEDIVIEEYKRPTHFFPYICLDTGWVDKTAVLAGYVDFLNQLLIVEQELILSRVTTRELAEHIFSMERQLYKDCWHPVRRIGDMTPQQVADLIEAMRDIAPRDYPVSFSTDVKTRRPLGHNIDPQIAKLRSAIQGRNIRILKCCTGLVEQLKTGTQDEHGRFDRSEEHGHYDAIAALKYLYSYVKWRMNPFPDPTMTPNQFIAPWEEMEVSRDKALITHNPVMVTRRKLW
jgi:hypothetical protein